MIDFLAPASLDQFIHPLEQPEQPAVLAAAARTAFLLNLWPPTLIGRRNSYPLEIRGPTAHSGNAGRGPGELSNNKLLPAGCLLLCCCQATGEAYYTDLEVLPFVIR